MIIDYWLLGFGLFIINTCLAKYINKKSKEDSHKITLGAVIAIAMYTLIPIIGCVVNIVFFVISVILLFSKHLDLESSW